ncbi:hypothetical protein [Roseibium aggregatum]|uniref:hypothetical protein n=1 Tax=Roseibium aggregatum TaxID=187304 RepID=UPI00094AE9B5|nr:hypothetical protein [Roseibium aggregatum]UFI02151.1 hypothetical protein ST40_019310 [Roseibium aggregatum]
MASRGQKQPFAVVHNRVFFCPDDEFWQATQKAFQCGFSDNQRVNLDKIIDRYFREVQLEQAAASMKASEKLVGEIQNATTKLLDLLTEKDNRNAEKYTLELIDLEVCRLLNNDHGLARVRAILQDLNRASKNSLETMQDEPETAFKSGLAWAEMVQNLTRWAEDYGLPSAARNEGVSGDTVTPFTDFVFAIQSSACFPKSMRAHMHSKGALGKAITRARKVSAYGQI